MNKKITSEWSKKKKESNAEFPNNNQIINHILKNPSRRQLHKNVESNIEQVLTATPNKALTIRPPASHHENYTS